MIQETFSTQRRYMTHLFVVIPKTRPLCPSWPPIGRLGCSPPTLDVICSPQTARLQQSKPGSLGRQGETPFQLEGRYLWPSRHLFRLAKCCIPHTYVEHQEGVYDSRGLSKEATR
jgi:hypothetical protein